MQVTGHLDPEEEALPLEFRSEAGTPIDGVDLCWLGRRLMAQEGKKKKKKTAQHQYGPLEIQKHQLYLRKKVVIWLMLQRTKSQNQKKKKITCS